MWNQSINLLNSQFSPLMLSSIINLYDMRYSGETVTKMSAYCSIVVIIAAMGALVAIIIRLLILSRNMNEESVKEFNKKYSPLTSDLIETS